MWVPYLACGCLNNEGHEISGCDGYQFVAFFSFSSLAFGKFGLTGLRL